MGLFDLAGAATALEDLFDRERDAILTGRFDVLERLGAEKERLAGSVARKGGAAAELTRLKRLAERNRGLLAAMEEGVRAAVNRIEALRRGPGALQTYDATGRRQTIAAPATATTHRA